MSFRFSVEREYPEGTVIRPLAENELIQSEGDRLCVYRRGPDDDIHYVCRVDLMDRVTHERGSEVDEAHEHAYGEDLETRVQRIIEAREAAQNRGGGGGVTVPPLSSAREWRIPQQARPVVLPVFGQGPMDSLAEKGNKEQTQEDPLSMKAPERQIRYPT